MKNVESFHSDLLGLSAFATRLEAFIKVERQYVPGGLVISLDGRFGHGKTTFLKMWKDSIDTNPLGGRPRVVLLNAWESDFLGDPLSAIVASLATAIGPGSDVAGGMVSAVKKLGRFAIALGGQYASKHTGFDYEAAGDYAQNKSDGEAASMKDSAYSVYRARESALKALKNEIGRLSDGDGGVIVLVDELDRCRPDYAISYLETMKHVFDVAGLTFILAVDRGQLKSVAQVAFGDELDFSEYYRKFVHREVSLPAITKEGHSNLAKAYVAAFLETAAGRISRLTTDQCMNDRLIDLFTNLRMTPRQLQEVFRILGHLGEVNSGDDRGNTLFVDAIGAAVMVALKVGAFATYQAAGHGRLEVESAKAFAERHCSDYKWLLGLLFIGGSLRVPETMEDVEFVKLTRMSSDLGPDPVYLAMNRRWIRWDRDDKPLRSIFNKIETLGEFR